MDNKTLTLAQRLKKFRESVLVDGKPISARAFAMSISVDQSHYNKCEKGERNLSADNYKDIQTLYGLNLNWLLTGEGEMSIPTTSEKVRDIAKETGKPHEKKSLRDAIKQFILGDWLTYERNAKEIEEMAEVIRLLEEKNKEDKKE